MIGLLGGRDAADGATAGLRMLKFLDVLSRQEAGSLSQIEAAELLGMSERTSRRWTRRFEEEGEDGLLDKPIGLPTAPTGATATKAVNLSAT
jgi:Helix-turn-helix domain